QRRRYPRAQHVLANARTQSLREEREEHGAHPAAEMARVRVRGIVVHRKAAGGCVRRELRLGEWQERSDQPPTRARGDPGEPGWSAAAEQAQDDRFDLVVLVMSGHEVAGAATTLDVAQPGVSSRPRGRLRRLGAEVELAELELEPVARRELQDGASDRPAVRRDAVIDVRDHEGETERR